MSKPERNKEYGADEGGFALITVMLVMILLLGLAMAAINSTILEMNIARNNKEYTTAFHKADGGAMETIQIMENSKNPLDLIPLYMEGEPHFKFIQTVEPKYRDYTLFSQYSKIGGWNNPADLRASQLLNDKAKSTVRSIALYRGPSSDSSSRDDAGSAKMYEYTVYGQAKEGGTPVIIAIGYRVRM